MHCLIALRKTEIKTKSNQHLTARLIYLKSGSTSAQPSPETLLHAPPFWLTLGYVTAQGGGASARITGLLAPHAAPLSAQTLHRSDAPRWCATPRRAARRLRMTAAISIAGLSCGAVALLRTRRQRRALHALSAITKERRWAVRVRLAGALRDVDALARLTQRSCLAVGIRFAPHATCVRGAKQPARHTGGRGRGRAIATKARTLDARLPLPDLTVLIARALETLTREEISPRCRVRAWIERRAVQRRATQALNAALSCITYSALLLGAERAAHPLITPRGIVTGEHLRAPRNTLIRLTFTRLPRGAIRITRA